MNKYLKKKTFKKYYTIRNKHKRDSKLIKLVKKEAIFFNKKIFSANKSGHVKKLNVSIL